MYDFLTTPLFLAIILPLACFFFGIMVADFLSLHKVRRLHMYVMGVPVGLFVVGVMSSSSMVQVNTGDVVITRYGFMENHSSYLQFVAVLMFMGASTPSLFEELRRRFSKPPTETINTGANRP